MTRPHVEHRHIEIEGTADEALAQFVATLLEAGTPPDYMIAALASLTVNTLVTVTRPEGWEQCLAMLISGMQGHLSCLMSSPHPSKVN